MKRECILYCLHSLEGSDVARDRDGKGEHRFSVLHSAAVCDDDEPGLVFSRAVLIPPLRRTSRRACPSGLPSRESAIRPGASGRLGADRFNLGGVGCRLN
jgi:hypothetical protein